MNTQGKEIKKESTEERQQSITLWIQKKTLFNKERRRKNYV